MASGLLGTAISGLLASQRSIETTSHNIANVNTEGYSRQRADLKTNAAEFTGSGFIGTGVHVGNISRSYDQFISAQLRSSSSAYGEVDQYKNFAARVDNLLADPKTGLSPAIQSFFNAVNDVANDPSSITARDVLLAEGESLSQRFTSISSRFEELRNQVNADLKSSTETINSYTAAIADLNQRISSDSARLHGQQQPNDLLDQRDVLLNKLSELVDTSVVPQEDGMVTVLMGNGLPLLIGDRASTLGVQADKFDPTKQVITLQQEAGNTQIISHHMAGGKLAGVLRFRDEMLDPAQQKLGAVAAAVAMQFNAIHKAGYDLQGEQGEAFFKFSGTGGIPVLDVSSNPSAATLTAEFSSNAEDSANLDTSDYLLKYDGNYTLTRMSDDTVIALTVSSGPPFTLSATAPDTLPGIKLEIDATPAVDDQFFIRPTYQAAKELTMNITDPDKIAAATNLDTDGVTVINGPMPGDNRNALRMAALANTTSMFAGTATIQDAYGQIVSKVGSLTNAANIGAIAQETLLNRAIGERENLAGVNLDEEAANLIKFQQSYQAAAQTISTARAIFDTLMGAVR